MKFNEKIVRLRKIKGITQDEFASAVGVSRQAVYKWESGQSYPEVAKLIEIKLLFNVSIDDLLDDSFEVILPEKKKKKKSAEVAPKTAPAPEKVEAQVKEEETKEEVAPVVTVTAEPVVMQSPTDLAISTEVEKEKAEPEKKSGFFGRLFGRK